MATCGENSNNWPRTVMTGGCLLVAFAPDGTTGNDDNDDWPGPLPIGQVRMKSNLLGRKIYRTCT